jgi:hypothetical protein
MGQTLWERKTISGVSMGQTLWERLTKGKEPLEFKYTNPAKAKIGCSFIIDSLDYKNLIFTLHEIIEYKRNINGKELFFADYVLIAKPIGKWNGKEEVLVRTRFMPIEIPDSQFTHNVILMTKYEEMKFNEELDNVLRDNTGELLITDDSTGEEEQYWRLNDLKNSYHADLSIVTNQNVENKKVEYWDFSRITLDEANQQFTQYMFVEMDKYYKVQTMWRGQEIDTNSVSIL